MTVAIDCFSTAGNKLWSREHESTRNIIEMQLPLGVFAPIGDHLIYSIGQDLWTLSAADGTDVQAHHENAIILPRLLGNSPDDSAALHFITAQHELVAYNPANGAVILRTALPENTTTFLLRDKTLYATNGASVFAFNLTPSVSGSRLQWNFAAGKDERFIRVFESHEGLWALREDGTLLQMDRSTGKILAEQSILWPPSGLHLSGNKLYSFTSDRAAFALELVTINK